MCLANLRRRNLWLTALENRATPATFTVSALTDIGAGAGLAGDLRYCITQAEVNAGADVIDASGVIGSLTLNSALPTITQELVVFGPGSDKLAIDANFGSRHLQIDGAGGTEVSFRGMEFRKGDTIANGGAVLVNNAKATFIECNFVLNFAGVGGALFGTPSSSLNVLNCSASGNSGSAGGGAIYAAGQLSVRNTTLSGNSTGPSGSGGAIAVGGSGGILVSNSTLSGNSADINGGAIRILSVFTGSFQLKNSTVTLNKVSDPSGTGRGISRPGSGGTIQIYSSIVAQNTGGTVTTSDVAGTVTANFCLIGTTDAAAITGTFNHLGTNASPIDAKLAPLANNGGTSRTHLPMPGSLAEEGGDNEDLLTHDQRGLGFMRTEGYTTDIGAVDTEYFLPLAARIDPVVNASSPNTTYQFTVTYYDPRGSKLIDYSSLGTGDIYVTGPNGYFEVPTFISATPTVDAETIVATYEIPVPMNAKAGWDISDNGNYPITVFPNEIYDKDMPTPNAGISAAFALMRVEVPIIYTVDEVSDVVDGKTGFGEVSLREAIDLANSDNEFSRVVFDSSVFATGNTITLTGGEFKLNAAVQIAGPDAKLTINAAGASRIFTTAGAPAKSEITIAGLTLINGASASGGAMFVTNQDVTLMNCDFNGNSATVSYGGAVHIESGFRFTAQDCTFTNNSASDWGGAVIATFGPISSMTLRRCQVTGNSAGASGGGVHAFGTLVIEDSLISANASGVRGGGVVFTPNLGGTFFLRNSTISDNTATYGGGIHLYSIGSPDGIVLQNSTITGNKSSDAGGGITIYSGGFPTTALRLESAIVSGNSSGTGGPDINYSIGNVIAKNSAIGSPIGFTLINAGGNLPFGADLRLAPLANNGGPTMTHALLPGSPAINSGSNTLSLIFDQRGAGFDRVVGAAADIGAFEVQSTPTPPAKISMFKVNDGSAQRSRVTSLTITFDSAVTLPMDPADAFELKRHSDGMVVDLDALVSGNSVVLTFTGGPLNFGSLADGRYTLTAKAAQINGGNFDGDGNGTAGDDYVLVGTPANGLFRLFGDADGNGTVNTVDFNAFRSAFGGSSTIFDFDNAGGVGTLDFNQFRTRFGSSV